jgi:hypothetical protein
MKHTFLLLGLLLGCFKLTLSSTITFKISDKSYSYEELNQVDSAVALLILFDGGAGYAKNIAKETKIPNEASNYKFQCIGLDFTETYVSDSAYENFKAVINYAIGKYKVTRSNLFIGGFSGGGYAAVRYTEVAVQKKDSNCIPRAIFAVDPPLDFFNLYEYCINEIDRDCDNEQSKTLGKSEAKWIKNDLELHLGLPQQDSIKYIDNSCFTPYLKDGGNARFLLDIPINMIHEIDLMWKIRDRCRDLNYSSVLISSMMINKLYNQGNKSALITTTNNLGYRADGTRNPHSWSIAEPKTTLDWLIKYIKN